MYATEVEFPYDNCRMQYMSCAGHEGYWNGCRHSLHVMQRAVQQQMEIISSTLSNEEVYFNPVNTRLTKHFHVFRIFSPSDGADFAVTHLCNKEVFGKTTKDLTDFPSN